MSELSMIDMNSLNAIAGSLRVSGYHKSADVLVSIQGKATKLIEEKSKLLNTVVDLVYNLLDECDISVWEDIGYIALADVWCEAVEADPSEEAIKARLRKFFEAYNAQHE